MAVRFRCNKCQGLLSISSRRIGAVVACPTCGAELVVPAEDVFSGPEPASGGPPAESQMDEDWDSGEEIVFAEASVTDEDEESPAEPAADAAQQSRAPAQPAAEPPPESRSPTGGPAEEPPEFRVRRVQTEFEDMDLTPMVDVVFLLLIFFMVTASFTLQKTLEVPAPDPDQEGATQTIQNLSDLEDTSIIVQVDDQNAILVDDEPLADPRLLADALRDKMRLEQKTELVVSASAVARHRTVVAVIDAANEVGMQKIRWAVSRGGGD